MIVIDACTIVGADLKRDGVPRQAILKAWQQEVIALSSEVAAEIRGVFARQKFAHALTDEDRIAILAQISDTAVWVEPMLKVNDCHDAKDNEYLELAATAGAEIIITSDDDLPPANNDVAAIDWVPVISEIAANWPNYPQTLEVPRPIREGHFQLDPTRAVST